ncbi:phage tail assembly chaperone [Parasphingorhabdus sp. JC815]|uniref:phage tail assembly chaperone n=1 Tax=Parasphingorhabdus sp. JC815 TaxID=3232140 RepID=UPI00345A8A54
MGHDFRTCAAQLAGVVPAIIGWTPDQYWHATPAELAAILTALSPAGDSARPLNKSEMEKLKDTLENG